MLNDDDSRGAYVSVDQIGAAQRERVRSCVSFDFVLTRAVLQRPYPMHATVTVRLLCLCSPMRFFCRPLILSLAVCVCARLNSCGIVRQHRRRRRRRRRRRQTSTSSRSRARCAATAMTTLATCSTARLMRARARATGIASIKCSPNQSEWVC